MDSYNSSNFDPFSTYIISRNRSSDIVSESQTSEGQTSEHQISEGQTSEHQISEGQTSEHQTSEHQTSEDQISEGQISGYQPLDLSSERQEEESFESYQKKLHELRKECFEKILDRKLIKKTIDNIQFSEFLQKELEADHDSTLGRTKRYLKHRLREINSLQEDASAISKENAELEQKILKKKVESRDCLKRRKKLWDEAVRMYAFKSGKLTHLDYLDCSTRLDDSTSTDISRQESKMDELKRVTMDVSLKSARIIQLSRVLHNLICFSGLPWATDKNLRDIVVCTGQILGRKFSDENHRAIKATDDIICKLNKIKI